MKNIRLLLSMLMVIGFAALRAQVVTTEPAVLQPSSQNIVIYFHADQGNRGLINQAANDPIYAHTGVITNKSTSRATGAMLPHGSTTPPNTNCNMYRPICGSWR